MMDVIKYIKYMHLEYIVDQLQNKLNTQITILETVAGITVRYSVNNLDYVLLFLPHGIEMSIIQDPYGKDNKTHKINYDDCITKIIELSKVVSTAA